MRLGVALGALVLLAPSVTDAGPDTPAALGQICAAPAPGPSAKAAQEILSGYGSGGFAIRTANPAAQTYFDNGMQLGHAFAHKASIAAFQEAGKLDPTCAMCAWGEAWARGPTINYPIDAKEQAALAALADKAAALAKDNPERERRLIAAMQARYRHGGGKGRGDDHFARAMDALARDYPEDNEIAIVAADAWMIPASHRESRENLPRAMELLTGALARRPDDTGAIHFYIHATEMAGIGDRAERYAERLQGLAPAASHLVHMPSHTYYIVGRYADAVRSNQAATQLDAANARRQGFGDDAWRLAYHGHNVQFATGAALMSGDADAAQAQSDAALAHLAATKSPKTWDQVIGGTAYFAQGRYAAPQKVLAMPEPAADRGYLRVMWRYARGEAYARLGDAAGVRAEAAAIRISPADLKGFGDYAPQGQAMVDVARLVLEGRAAMLEERPTAAAEAYAKAARLQETRLGRMSDPPGWWYPVRRSLAAALLEVGRTDDAATQARKVLATWPNDPMTLIILARAERKLGRGDEAERHVAEARRGWSGDPTTARPATL